LVVVGIVGVIAIFSALWPNRLAPGVRWTLVLPGLGLVVLSGYSGTGDQRGALAFGAVVAFLILGKKWNMEIEEDLDARRRKGKPSLMAMGWGRVHWDPFWGLLYRRRMMSDPWSRKRLLKRSTVLPGRLDCGSGK
jgi:hypothetical protein